MPERQATTEAAATAAQAVREQHGDNDPDASARLRFMVADLDARFGRVVACDGAMCDRTYRLVEC